jgi:phosphatidylglycerophosphatase A
MICNFRSIFARIISTCGYIGFSKVAPGTVASFFTSILIYFSIEYIGDWFAILLFLFSISIGWYATIVYLNETKKSDPQEVVIDEFAGQSIAILLSKSILDYLGFFDSKKMLLLITLSFILFRIFDITKIFPVSYFDKMDNAFGVMMDDVVAGFMASFIVVIMMIFI